MKILILCTGNSCRSQMAAGFLRSFDERLEVHSAGTAPVQRVNKDAVHVMAEKEINISHERPKPVEKFLNDHWDFVITVCDDADLSCPLFLGDVKTRLHMGFEDPSRAVGTDEEILDKFRLVRDGIREAFLDLYLNSIKPLVTENQDEIFGEMLEQYTMLPPRPGKKH